MILAALVFRVCAAEHEVALISSIPTEILVNVSGLGYFLFIGAGDHFTEGVWKTSESDYKCGLQFYNWNKGEPNNHVASEDCAAIGSLSNGKWVDISCSVAIPFLCQIFE